MSTTLPHAQVLPLQSLVTPADTGIASRVLARTAAGNVTLFAFGAGQELPAHTAPVDVMVLTLSGTLRLEIAGEEVRATPETIVVIPANQPHAVFAAEPARMLLLMLREPKMP
jgi:quercetin dioxygenase-like cupin family protein